MVVILLNLSFSQKPLFFVWQETFDVFVGIPILPPDFLQFFMHIFPDSPVRRIFIYVTHLLRIVLEIIQLPFIDIVVEMNELVALRPYTIMSLDHMDRDRKSTRLNSSH